MVVPGNRQMLAWKRRSKCHALARFDSVVIQGRASACLKKYPRMFAAVWLYGVISYTVAQRTNEIGIRMALGSQRSGVVRLILGEVAVLIGIGIVVGAGLTLAGGKAAGSLLYGLQARDPMTLAAAAVLLGAIGFAASFIPTRRATRVDPMVALRYE